MLTLKVTVWGIISAGNLKQGNWPENTDINNQQREVLYWGILIKDFTQSYSIMFSVITMLIYISLFMVSPL